MPSMRGREIKFLVDDILFIQCFYLLYQCYSVSHKDVCPIKNTKDLKRQTIERVIFVIWQTPNTRF